MDIDFEVTLHGDYLLSVTTIQLGSRSEWDMFEMKVVRKTNRSYCWKKSFQANKIKDMTNTLCEDIDQLIQFVTDSLHEEEDHCFVQLKTFDDDQKIILEFSDMAIQRRRTFSFEIHLKREKFSLSEKLKYELKDHVAHNDDKFQKVETDVDLLQKQVALLLHIADKQSELIDMLTNRLEMKQEKGKERNTTDNINNMWSLLLKKPCESFDSVKENLLSHDPQTGVANQKCVGPFIQAMFPKVVWINYVTIGVLRINPLISPHDLIGVHFQICVNGDWETLFVISSNDFLSSILRKTFQVNRWVLSARLYKGGSSFLSIGMLKFS